jgi:hypothetical protein
MVRLTLSIGIGKGVLGKDKKPFAPQTIHYIDGEWNCPASYSVETLLALLTNDATNEIQVIDRNNKQFTIRKVR